MNEGESVRVDYDNDTAKDNLMSFLRELGIVAQCDVANNQISFTLGGELSKETLPQDSEIHCPTTPAPSTGSYVVAVRSERMGEGDEKLGSILLRAFLNTLPQSEKPLPSHILLYNSGVNVALEGVDCVESLKEMQNAGVKIIACGTCLDFYEVKEKLAVGTVGNMLDIASVLVDAHHVVYL